MATGENLKLFWLMLAILLPETCASGASRSGHPLVRKETQRVVDLRTISPDIFDRGGQNIYQAAKVIQNELAETSANLNKVREVQELAEESMRKLKNLEQECKERSSALKEAEVADIRRLQRLLGVVRQKAEVENRISSQLEEILSQSAVTGKDSTGSFYKKK